jgi:hypothetical protein
MTPHLSPLTYVLEGVVDSRESFRKGLTSFWTEGRCTIREEETKSEKERKERGKKSNPAKSKKCLNLSTLFFPLFRQCGTSNDACVYVNTGVLHMILY